jgi:hypothetical protein
MSFELILPFLRPIEPLLLDDSISEIMGNPDASWWYERDGIVRREDSIPSTPASFAPASKWLPTSSVNGWMKTTRSSTRSFRMEAAWRLSFRPLCGLRPP